MLPNVFKRKLRIVLAGKTLFTQQSGDVGTFFVVLIMATIIGGSYFLVNGTPPKFLVQDPLDPDKDTTYSLDEKKIAKGKHDSLQLKNIPFVSNTPTPPPEENQPNGPRDRSNPTRPPRGPNEIVITQGPSPSEKPPSSSCGIADPALKTGQRSNGSCCVEDGPVNNASDCCEGVPTCKQIMDNPSKYSSGSHQYFCDMDPQQAALWCNAKPVIYLYPTKQMVVDVVVAAPGPIVVSDPLYPTNGWKNVLAHPGGKLVYQGKTYKELFYEAAIPPLDSPKTGVIVKKEEVRTELVRIAIQRGLIGFERDDFVNFWNGRLSELSSPYVLLSVFSQEAKETFDHVIISPAPDTFIQFIAYFKPLKNPYPIAPLVLPHTTPERKGFTAVEWGGILDH